MKDQVLLFSGGRTSGLMLRILLDTISDYRDRFVTCFCNTGKEMQQTLDFVHEVETRWEVPIVWLEYTRALASEVPSGIFPTQRRNQNLAKLSAKGQTTHWFRRVDYQTASRNGEPFDEFLESSSALPNPTGRGCSAQLKIRTTHRFLFASGIKEFESFIGIRSDESHRAIQILATTERFIHPKFPLIERNISKKQVDEFWAKSDFDLLLSDYQGNCDLCFLKAKWKRIKMIRENPGMVEWWKLWEERKSNPKYSTPAVFRLGESYRDLELIAQQEDRQGDLFAEQDIPCSCAERGFEHSEDI